MANQTVALILAGGSGDRFWPISRGDVPKQLLNLVSPGESLLSETVSRVAPLIPREKCFIATSTHLFSQIAKANLVPWENIFTEPSKRNTLGGVLWGLACLIVDRDLEESDTLAVLASDHYIGNSEAFIDLIGTACEIAGNSEKMIMVGIPPSRPETGFGYMEMAELNDSCDRNIVLNFKEKPDFCIAQEYFESGNYLWNSGMFFTSVGTLLKELETCIPEVNKTFLSLIEAMRGVKGQSSEKVFNKLPNESMDSSLLEKSKNLEVLTANFAWDDVGTWTALERIHESNSHGNIVRGNCVVIDSNDCIIQNRHDGMELAVIGLEGIVVVASENGILVCPKEHAQRVKEVPQTIRSRKKSG